MNKHVIAIIQARTGSTRLPGKTMYPLNGNPVLKHIITRASSVENISEVVVATSNKSQDDVITQYGPKFGAAVVRGDESNVLNRFAKAVEQYNPDVVVRLTGDNPLVSTQFIKSSIERLEADGADYISGDLDRTFPLGITCETFTSESFDRVKSASNAPRHREHVTPYYREQPDKFSLVNLSAEELFTELWLQNRTDLRLTLDEPADYQILETVYREVPFEDVLDVREAIEYIDEHELADINQHIKQKSI